MIIFKKKYFFQLSDGVLVSGATNTLVLDFNSGELFRANKSAKRIIELGEIGLTLSEISEYMGIEASDLLFFIEKLVDQKIVTLSSEPLPERTAKKYLPRLDFLWIEVTSRCNLHCLHCYADAKSSKDVDPFTEDIKRWIDEAADLGCKKVQFTGGECTLRDDLMDLVDHAKIRGFESVEVFTNGTLLSEDLISHFSKNGVNVAISLYSYRSETHDTITGVQGSFEKTLENLKLILAYEVPVRCAVIAMNKNEDELEETCWFLQQLGVLCRSPDPIRPSGRGKDMVYWPQKYGLRKIQTQPNFLATKEAYEKNRFWNDCWYGKIAITSEGNVLPCVFARDQIAGNVKDRKLKTIIEKDILIYWGMTKDLVKVCKDCEYRYLCYDCRPWAYGFTGDLYAKSPRCTYDPYTGEWGIAEDALIHDCSIDIDIQKGES